MIPHKQDRWEQKMSFALFTWDFRAIKNFEICDSD